MTTRIVRLRLSAISGPAALLAWLCAVTPSASAANTCTLQAVTIEAAASEPSDTYIGRTAALELRFHNDKTSGPVDAFPEPPLTVKQLKTSAECKIDDGGIWVRQHVYASGDGQVLVTHEYSGSNDELVFYDTHTCRRKARVDVSNAKWAFKGGAVLVTPSKAGKVGKRSSQVKLDAACLPVPSAGLPIRR